MGTSLAIARLYSEKLDLKFSLESINYVCFFEVFLSDDILKNS